MAKRPAAALEPSSPSSPSPSAHLRAVDPGLKDDVHSLILGYLVHSATQHVLNECAMLLADRPARADLDAVTDTVNSHLKMVDSFFNGFVKARPHLNTPTLSLRLRLLQFATLLGVTLGPRSRLSPESVDQMRSHAQQRSRRWWHWRRQHDQPAWMQDDSRLAARNSPASPRGDEASPVVLADLIRPFVALTAARSRLGEEHSGTPATSFRSSQVSDVNEPWHVLPIWLALAADLMYHAAVQCNDLPSPLADQLLLTTFAWGPVSNASPDGPSTEDVSLNDIFTQLPGTDGVADPTQIWYNIRDEALCRLDSTYTPQPWPHVDDDLGQDAGSERKDTQLLAARLDLQRRLLGFVEALLAGITPPLLAQLDKVRAGEADEVEYEGIDLTEDEIARLVAIVEEIR